MENENKRLHEWFGLCYHGIKGGIVRPARCVKGCGFRVSIAEWRLMNERANLDFSTESGFFALLSGLRAKGFRRKNESHALINDGTNVYRPTGEWVMLFRFDDNGNEIDVSEATADTLPEALFNAAIKALDSEGTE